MQVTADPVALQTDSSDLSLDISRETLEYLPNIGKNPLNFAASVAGLMLSTDVMVTELKDEKKQTAGATR